MSSSDGQADERILYWGSWSPPCLRTHIMLHEKQLKYKSHVLDFQKGEHKSDLITRLNPRGQLPVYEEGDVVLSASLAAMIWIEEQHSKSGTQLLPPLSERKRRAMVWQRVAESQVLAPKFVDPFHMKAWNQVNSPEGKRRFQEMIDELKQELQYWESYLSQSRYVAGDEYTLADVATAPYLLFAQYLGASFKAYPKVIQYVEEIKARPAVAGVLSLHEQADTMAERRSSYFSGLI